MNQSKNWYESKTIWGVIICLIGWIGANVFDVPVSVGTSDPSAGLIVSEITQLLGLALAIFGRVKAISTIKLD